MDIILIIAIIIGFIALIIVGYLAYKGLLMIKDLHKDQNDYL